MPITRVVGIFKTSKLKAYFIACFIVFHYISFTGSTRNGQRRCSVRKSVLRNFAKFTEKHLCQILGPEACNVIKKEILARVFSCKFYEIPKITFFKEHPRAAASNTKSRSLLFSCHRIIFF